MKNWKKHLLATTLVLSMAVPAAVHAENAASHTWKSIAGAKLQDAGQHKEGKHFGEHKFHHGMKYNVHRQMYLTLLAEKYTPESVDQWKAVFAERARLVEELKALSGMSKEKEEKAGNRQTNEKKAEFIAIREKMKQNREEFNGAIASGDAAKIKAVLPKLLEEMQASNKRLADKLEKKKN